MRQDREYRPGIFGCMVIIQRRELTLQSMVSDSISHRSCDMGSFFSLFYK